MAFKTKISLEDGEAYVIAPVEFWEHLIQTYQSLAEQQEGRDYWFDAADFINRWLDTTLYIAPAEEEEGWN